MIGYSTHNLSQVEDAMRLPVDYIAFGPIFETSTKTDHEPLVGLTRLREIKERLGQKPLVAIGGITGENFGDTLTAGADSAAIISDLLKEPAKIAEKLSRMVAIRD
jgi:thiamine-phosphate pyrophosphorylase